MKRKDGEELQFHVIILPITGHGGLVPRKLLNRNSSTSVFSFLLCVIQDMLFETVVV